MRIIPVMDLKGGHVVHAVGGRREEYLPVQSQLVASSRPEIVARAFRDQLGLHELYVADLDAIAGHEPAWDVYHTLGALELALMVDAGVRDVATARSVQASGVSGIVIGLETVGGPSLIGEVVDELGPDSIWFSLDLKNGLPLGNVASWPDASAEGIVSSVIAQGVTRLVVLDLAHVGERRGTGTEQLCGRLIARHPTLQIVAGGGIRDTDDLGRLAALGVSGALVATALHDGRIRS